MKLTVVSLFLLVMVTVQASQAATSFYLHCFINKKVQPSAEIQGEPLFQGIPEARASDDLPDEPAVVAVGQGNEFSIDSVVVGNVLFHSGVRAAGGFANSSFFVDNNFKSLAMTVGAPSLGWRGTLDIVVDRQDMAYGSFAESSLLLNGKLIAELICDLDRELVKSIPSGQY